MYYHRVSAVEILAKASLAGTLPTNSHSSQPPWCKGTSDEMPRRERARHGGPSGCLSQMDCMAEHAADVGVRSLQRTTSNSSDLRQQTNSSEAGDRRTHNDRDETTTLDQSATCKNVSNTGSRLSVQFPGAHGSARQPTVQLPVLCFYLRTGRCKFHLQLVRTASMAHSRQRIADSDWHSWTSRHGQQHFYTDGGRQYWCCSHAMHAGSRYRSSPNAARRPGRPASRVQQPVQQRPTDHDSPSEQRLRFPLPPKFLHRYRPA